MTREAGQGSGSSERMGGYDQFISLLFYVLQIIYVSYIHLCRFICSNDFISSILLYYNRLYLSVLILQSCCLCSVSLYAYHIYMIYMIHMLYVLLIHIDMDQFEIMISTINYLLYVIIIMLIYGIKMIWKMPIFLTETAYVAYKGTICPLPSTLPSIPSHTQIVLDSSDTCWCR
jgi:hypothetical protein